MKILRTACAAALIAGLLALTPTTVSAQIVPGPVPADLASSFDVTGGVVQQITVPDEPDGQVALQVWLDGALMSIVLQPHDIRTRDFVLQIADASGVRTVPTPSSVTYRGQVAGHAQSAVAATIRDGRLRAVVTLNRNDTFGIQPIDANLAGRNDLYVVYAKRDLADLDVECGVVEGPSATGPEVAFNGGLTQVVEIACEADVPFFQKNGSDVFATHDDILLVMAGCDVIYDRDTSIQMRVKSMLVRTATDPYTTTTSSPLLGEFRTWWNTNQTGTPRDLAHLFTGRNLDSNIIGVAYLSVVCSSYSSYGLSESRYTTNLVNRVGLTAHELGHNWGAGHCNSSDPCWIMCSGLGGCSNDVTAFAPVSITAITNHKASRTCLSNPYIPALTTLSPSKVGLLQPEVVTLFGNELQFATAVNVGAQVLTGAWFHVIDNHTIQFLAPTATTFQSAPVSVTTPTGTTNALALVRATDPAALVAPMAPVAGSAMTWQFGGYPGDDYYLVISVDGLTLPVLGKPALINFFVLAQGQLDALGLGSFQFPLPAQIAGLTFYSQVAVVNGQSLTLRDVTNIVPSTVVSGN